MKLTPAEYDKYYESIGIKESDLMSPEPLTLAELPADANLSDTERNVVVGVLRQWNPLDARMKVDAAHAMERRVLAGHHPEHVRRVDAWAAYLLLGRVRGCDERHDRMLRVARGEELLPAPKPRKRRPRPAAAPEPSPATTPSYQQQIDARLRAEGLKVVIEKIQHRTADGDAITIHHVRAVPI